jgi:hypothetical protein
MQIRVSVNELSALLKRCFEGLGYSSGDYADAATACIWMETHALNGLALLMESWQHLVDGASLSPTIRATAGANISVDANRISLLVCGQSLAELAISKLQDDGVNRIDVYACRNRIAIVPGIAAIAQRGYSALAHWRCKNFQYYAVASAGNAMPRIAKFALTEPQQPAAETLHLICSRAAAEIESALRSLNDMERRVTHIVEPASMLECFNNSIERGVQVDNDIWVQLYSAADAVLVKATEQSRRGAGA